MNKQRSENTNADTKVLIEVIARDLGMRGTYKCSTHERNYESTFRGIIKTLLERYPGGVERLLKDTEDSGNSKWA